MARRIPHITVGDLPATAAYGVALYCPKCQSEFSATRGDYWSLPRDHVFRCCGRVLLRLVRKRTVLEAITPVEAGA